MSPSFINPFVFSAGSPPPTDGVTANAPAWIEAGAVAFTDSPMEITAGGTYTGLRISAPDGINCVDVKTDALVVFRDCIFEHADAEAIYAPGPTASGFGTDPQVEVYNSTFLGRHPTTAGREIEKAIEYAGGSRFIVENCHFQRGRIYAYQHRAGASAVLRVRYNVGLNIDGREVDGSGNPVNTNTQVQQFFQHNGRTNIAGEFQIAWNEIWNESGNSAVEDCINLFATGGTVTNPVLVHHNLINGAYPSNPASTTYAGGGIMLSDGPGEMAYGLAEHNVVLASANYGMAITSGNHFTITNNRVFRTGKLPDGITEAMNNTGPGIYVYDYGTAAAFGDHEVSDNTIRWQDGDDPNGTNNMWVEFPGGNFTNTGNTSYGTVIDQAFIDAEVITYREGAIAAGITIGNNPDPEPPPPSGSLLGVGSASTSLVDYPKIANTTTGNKYVDGSVASSGTGNTLATAYKTIQEGLSAITNGQTLIVKGGTYAISGSGITRSTAWANLTRVMAYGSDTVILNGSGVNYNASILTFSGSVNELWHGFHARNQNAGGGNDGQVVRFNNGANNCTLSRFWVSHSQKTGFYAYVANNITFLDCAAWRLGDGTSTDTNVPDCFAMTGNANVGYPNIRYIRCVAGNAPDDAFDFYRNRNSLVQDCAIIDAGYYWNGNPSGDGNGAKMGSNESGVYSNTVRGSFAIGTRQRAFDDNNTTSGGNKFLNNTAVYGNIGFQIGSVGTTETRSNISLGNTTAVQNAGGTTTNNSWQNGVTLANVRFADTANGDYSLLPDSTAIGTGSSGTNMGASDVALALYKEWHTKDLT